MNPQIEAKQLLYKIQSIIKVNKDDRKKEIGDRVILWDYSGSIDTNGKHHNNTSNIEGQMAIVIQTNCQKKHTELYCKERILDLLIVFPTAKRFTLNLNL